MKEIDPNYVPIEERSKEEQEEAYDRMFDWEEETVGNKEMKFKNHIKK